MSDYSEVGDVEATSVKSAAPPPPPPPPPAEAAAPPPPPGAAGDAAKPIPPKSESTIGDSSQMDCFCIMWSFVWLGVLVLFAWPFSVGMAALYGFVSPMISLIGIEDISDSLLEGVNVGRQCARNVRDGVPML